MWGQFWPSSRNLCHSSYVSPFLGKGGGGWGWGWVGAICESLYPSVAFPAACCRSFSGSQISWQIFCTHFTLSGLCGILNRMLSFLATYKYVPQCVNFNPISQGSFRGRHPTVCWADWPKKCRLFVNECNWSKCNWCDKAFSGQEKHFNVGVTPCHEVQTSIRVIL